MKCFVFGVFLLLAGVAAQGQPVDVGNHIIAIVNHKVITEQDLRMELRDEAEALYRRLRSRPETFERELKVLRGQMIEEMIQNQLMLLEYETLKGAIPESLIESRINEEIKKSGDRLTFIKTLQAEGKTLESFRQRKREQTILEIMWQHRIQIDPTVSPSRIENFYLTNLPAFKTEDRIKFRTITLTNRVSDTAVAPAKLAREIGRRIDEGASFAEMARLYSEDSHAAEGGERGWVSRSTMAEELAKVAFALRPGERSDVIQTDTAVFLLYVDEIDPAHIRPLSEVRDEIEFRLKNNERRRLREQYVKRLKDKTYIHYF